MPSFLSCSDHLRGYSHGGNVSGQISCHNRTRPHYRPLSDRSSLNNFGAHPNVTTFTNRHIASKVSSGVYIDVTPNLRVMTNSRTYMENAVVTQKTTGVGNRIGKHHNAFT